MTFNTAKCTDSTDSTDSTDGTDRVRLGRLVLVDLDIMDFEYFVRMSSGAQRETELLKNDGRSIVTARVLLLLAGSLLCRLDERL